jgi:hypothetical protein
MAKRRGLLHTIRRFVYKKRMRNHHIIPVSDKRFVEMMFYRDMGYKLDLENPRTFNEKLQWLKIYNHRPEYTAMVDKAAAKEYVASIIGPEHIIPTLGLWDRFEDIDFSQLPEKFVLKTTHDSKSVVICTDRRTFDLEAARKLLTTSLQRSYYLRFREWPYKNVRGRIIAERYMEEDGSDTLTDYKVFCFSGVPKVILTVVGGHGDESRTLRRMYDTDWKLLPIALHGKPFVDEKQPKPDKLGEILALAEKLSAGKPHVRTDFYVIGGRVYFGEITFYHMSGMARIEPEEWNLRLGSWIRLPERAE